MVVFFVGGGGYQVYNQNELNNKRSHEKMTTYTKIIKITRKKEK